MEPRCFDGSSPNIQGTVKRKGGQNVGAVWVTQGRFWEQTGSKGAFTMVHMCTACHFMPKADFVSFLARTTATGAMGVSRLVPTSSVPAKKKSCVVSMQYGNILVFCLVFLAESSLPGQCDNSWKQSSWPATRTNQGVRCGRSKALSSETTSKLGGGSGTIRVELLNDCTALKKCRVKRADTVRAETHSELTHQARKIEFESCK